MVGRAPDTSDTPVEQFISGLNGRRDLAHGLKFTVEFLMQALGAGSASIFITEPDGKALRLSEIRGQGREPLIGLCRRVGEGITGGVALNREPVLVENINTDDRFKGMRNVEGHYGTESFIAAPIIHQGKLIGVVNLTDMLAPRAFNETDLTLLHELVLQGAEALAGLVNSERERTRSRSLAEKLEHARAELERATGQLSRIKSFNETILECVPLPVIAFDRSLHPHFFNGAAVELFGEDLASTSLLKLPIELEEDSWTAMLPAAVENGCSLSFDEAVFIPQDSPARTIKIIISPTNVELARPTVGGPIFQAADSLHWQAESLPHISDAAELQGCNTIGGIMVVEDIGEKVRLQQQLAQAERLAGIGKLAASVAHELNNPIDGVLRYIGLALKVEPDNERLTRYLNECRHGLQRMARIVSSLLEYSRSNRLEERLQPLGAMVQRALRLLEPRRLKAGVDVDINLDAKLDAPARECLLQCFVNVIRNAFDIMPDGGTLTITGTIEGKNEAVISFTDAGPGIPEDVIGRIFDPFFTTKMETGGTGLGLAVSRDLTTQCGGRVEAWNSSGGGATFCFRIPLKYR